MATVKWNMVHLIGSEQPGVGTVKHTLFAGYKMDVDGQSHSELTSSQYVMLPELFTEQNHETQWSVQRTVFPHSLNISQGGHMG